MEIELEAAQRCIKVSCAANRDVRSYHRGNIAGRGRAGAKRFVLTTSIAEELSVVVIRREAPSKRDLELSVTWVGLRLGNPEPAASTPSLSHRRLPKHRVDMDTF